MVAFKSLFSFALPMLALASPLVERNDGCNSGSLQCCTTVTSSTDSAATSAFGLLGILGPIKGLVGLTCVVDLVGHSCNQQTVCCTNNNFNGVVALGCTPINVNV